MRFTTIAAWLVIASGPSLADEPPPKPQPAQEKKLENAAAPAEKPAPVVSIERSNKPPDCVIKPVMTDDELRACGARIPTK
jgi:hypothetical protein